MRRKTLDTLLSATGLLLALVLLVAGGLLTWASTFAQGQVHDQLAAHGHPVGPRPGPEPTSPPPTRRDEFAWMATKGTKWVLRRCTDLLPYLVAMAVRDCLRVRRPEPPAPASAARCCWPMPATWAQCRYFPKRTSATTTRRPCGASWRAKPLLRPRSLPFSLLPAKKSAC